jgi:hypothetical protein
VPAFTLTLILPLIPPHSRVYMQGGPGPRDQLADEAYTSMDELFASFLPAGLGEADDGAPASGAEQEQTEETADDGPAFRAHVMLLQESNKGCGWSIGWHGEAVSAWLFAARSAPPADATHRRRGLHGAHAANARSWRALRLGCDLCLRC